MQLKGFVFELLKVAEKAANLARVIRAEEALFELLIQEKKGDQRNKRFSQDFKTLADVLIQETVRHDLILKFAGLGANINGEESNKFTNTIGDTIIVQLEQNESSTAALLSKVLDGNDKAASLLARTVHENVIIPVSDDVNSLPDVSIPEESIGIWIDPIDATEQYIKAAGGGSVSVDGVHSEGLRCVTVLIGVYDLQSGRPIIGCINQPFLNLDSATGKWTGRHIWGVSYNEHNFVGASCPLPDAAPRGTRRPTVTVSSSEDKVITSKLSVSFEMVCSSGAGYKLLCTVDHLVDSYLVSKRSTYKWDTCAPHALLLAQGGGLVDLKAARAAIRDGDGKALEKCQLKYHVANPGCTPGSVDCWANSSGIVAYTDVGVLLSILSCLQ